jgi:hypothetical protein
MRTFFLILILPLAACQTLPQNEGDPAKLSDVISKIKDDLATYQQYDAQAAAAGPLQNACGGSVGFTIDNVKIAVTTQTDDTGTGQGSATLPVGSAALSPSLSFSREVKGTQTLTFSLYPKSVTVARDAQTQAPASINASTYPIAASLQQLRDGLLEASKRTPCVSLIPSGTDSSGKPIADPGGTFAFGFTVSHSNTEGATVKFVVFSLGATETSQRQAGNTITVTFKARPGASAAL